MTELTAQTVGRRLKEAREAAGLNQEQVAAFMGVATPQISYWETGTRQIDLVSLTKMADLLGYDLSWFLKGKERNPRISVSYRSGKLSEEDLKAVAWAVRFVKNLEFLTQQLEADRESQQG